MRLRVPPPSLKVPPLKVSAVLVLVMLGFGVLIGQAARNSVRDRLVAARPTLKVVVHHPAKASSGLLATGEASAAEAAPAPETTEVPTPRAAKSPAPAHSKSHGSSSKTRAKERAGTHEAAPPKAAEKLPSIKHVFVVMLSSEPYAAVFGPQSAATYLTHTLEPKGALLPRYDAVAHEGLADELALFSGQGPTAQSAADCPEYTPLLPTGADPSEQVLGSGCVYPSSTATLPGELDAKHLSWRAYVGGIAEAGGPPGSCPHPAGPGPDPTNAAGASGPYATSINPVAYFAALAQSPACQKDDVALSHLAHDLAKPALTPNFAYIAPNRCQDGNPTPCTPGAATGLAPANAFLARVVPEILASSAYKRSGLLIVTVDQAPASGAFADSSSCCGQPSFPNLPAALAQTPSGRPRGGGAVGALLLSPFIKGPETSQEPYNHYSLLATIEQLFALHKLGYSALPAAKPLEPSLFIEAAG